MQINIIGGGAAGFFTAINVKELIPKAEVTILERGHGVLRKVAVSVWRCRGPVFRVLMSVLQRLN